ncbi:hypothetical protein TanjilG_15655 [Lupinus angustifolius]|uniref:Uncharacterized protein n=1 Tax=Lupinus angustifolius TaxID=3871 RepID=A0A1J7HW60_LUPAN|nr:hypothetical protein TanjilG_15655 [Lupinus angustifolius]
MADFSPCGTPTGLNAREPFDLQVGGRMYYNSEDMLWRRTLEEQSVFRQALELQSRRLMVNEENGNNDGNGNGKKSPNDLQECLEHKVPDSRFASPTKAIGNYMAAFSNGPNEIVDSDASTASDSSKFSAGTLLPPASGLDMGSFKSFNYQIPRFPSGHRTIGMFASTGGPIGI